MAGTFPDVHSETMFCTISPKGGTDVEFVTVLETVDVDQGDKPVDAITNLKGGRLIKRNPQEPTNITLDLYPVSISTVAGTLGGPSLSQLFQNPTTLDTSGKLTTSSSRNRAQFRIALLWTDDTAVSNAVGTTATDKVAYRYYATGAYLVSHKGPQFTDGVLKYTATFFCPPFDKSGTALITEESTDGSTGTELAALGSYT